MGDVHQRLLGTALGKLDKLTEKGRARRSLKTIDKHLTMLQQGESTFRDEVIASHLMKQLTTKFGSRGKTPKFVFLQAFEEELRGGSTPETERLKAVGLDKPFLGDERDADEKDEEEDVFVGGASMKSIKARRGRGGGDDGPKTVRDMLVVRSGHLGPIIERPAAMVSHSVFLRNLEAQLRLQLHRLGCEQPVFEAPWLFEETKLPPGADEALPYYDTMSVRESVEESEETLIRRLKLYKRAFGALILHFEALRPVLRDIKKCYDHLLNEREEELRDAKITKQNIEHYKKTVDLKNADIQFEGEDQLAEIQSQSQLLLKHIDKQESTIKTLNEILTYLETQLSEEHDMRHDSEDQQKLLLIDINDYRRKLGMEPRPQDYNSDIAMKTLLTETAQKAEGEEGEAGAEGVASKATMLGNKSAGTVAGAGTDGPMTDGGEQEEKPFSIPRDMTITTEDVMILKRALEIARNDLKEADAKIVSLEKTHGDVIPRYELLALKQAIIDLEEEHKNIEGAFANFGSQVEELHDQIEQLTKQREKLSEEVATARTSVTPRPSWGEFGEFVDGGPARWKSICQGQSSNATAEKLFLELTMRRPPGPVEYFPVLGSSPKVPIYERFDQRVRKRRLGRRDVAIMVHDIWMSRVDIFEVVKAMEAAVREENSGLASVTKSEIFGENSPRIDPFQDYFLQYFTHHYKNVTIRMEWIYNMLDACRRLQDIDGRLKLFLDILEDRRAENAYHVYRSQMMKLLAGLVLQSKKLKQEPGQLPLGMFTETIALVFPYKTELQIKRLEKAASKQANIHAEWSSLDYKQFFTTTDEGFVGGFAHEFRNQLYEDVEAYGQEILKYLLRDVGIADVPQTIDLARMGAGADKEVTVGHFYKCITEIDPSMPDEKIGQAIASIFLSEFIAPGFEAKTLPLIKLIKAHLPRPGSPNEFTDKMELDFEHIVVEMTSKVVSVEGAEAEQGAAEARESLTPQRRQTIRKSKSITLNNLALKLKSGGLVRSGRPDAPRRETMVTKEGFRKSLLQGLVEGEEGEKGATSGGAPAAAASGGETATAASEPNSEQHAPAPAPAAADPPADKPTD